MLAINLDEISKETKYFYDHLCELRRQVRNYMAHGAFGKKGEAFDFHSGAGAVPVLLDSRPELGRFSLTGDPEFDEEAAIATIEECVHSSLVGIEKTCAVWSAYRFLGLFLATGAFLTPFVLIRAKASLALNG